MPARSKLRLIHGSGTILLTLTCEGIWSPR
jgi:hypothetical protein